MATQPAPGKRPQFTLTKIFIAMLFAVVVFTCIGGIYREHQSRQTALYLIEEMGGTLATATLNNNKRTDSRNQALSFVKPIDDAKLLQLTPYARWLPGVQEVDLTGSEVSSEGLAALVELPNLTRLVLDKTKVDSSVVPYLACHAKLVEVSLCDTLFDDHGVDELVSQLPQLQRLRLANTPITDVGAERLRLAKRLVELDLGAKGITDTGVHEIKRLTQLQKLSLKGSQAGAGSITALEKLPALEEVDLTSSAFAPEDIARLQRALPGLTVTPSK